MKTGFNKMKKLEGRVKRANYFHGSEKVKIQVTGSKVVIKVGKQTAEANVSKTGTVNVTKAIIELTERPQLKKADGSKLYIKDWLEAKRSETTTVK